MTYEDWLKKVEAENVLARSAPELLDALKALEEACQEFNQLGKPLHYQHTARIAARKAIRRAQAEALIKG